MSKPPYLFCKADATEFKRQFAIQWLAAHEAIEYLNNCSRGWKNHVMAVEDAEFLAEKAWDTWVEVNGVAGICADD